MGRRALVEAYKYDVWGGFEVETFGNSATALIDRWVLFTARELDAETGLYHYRARAYSTELGRFLQQDPIGFLGGDLNLVRYVLKSPLIFTDPLGLMPGPRTTPTRNRNPSFDEDPAFDPVASCQKSWMGLANWVKDLYGKLNGIGASPVAGAGMTGVGRAVMFGSTAAGTTEAAGNTVTVTQHIQSYLDAADDPDGGSPEYVPPMFPNAGMNE